MLFRTCALFAALLLLLPSLLPAETTATAAEASRPNILYIMTDDHAAHAISAYGSKINTTPNIDRIARNGVRLTNCFATNALCAPSRATILTGKYSHKTGVKTHRDPPFDPATNVVYPQLLRDAGYQTAVIGKWHLKSDPFGFDYWKVLPGQGAYYDPIMIDKEGRKKYEGYVTDLIADECIKYLDGRDTAKPFLLLCHHKAPHRNWGPAPKYATLYENEDIPKPETYDDDYKGRARAAANAKMRISDDLTSHDVKGLPPPGLKGAALKDWHYQRYIKDYLRCVASVDENVGRLLDYLDANQLTSNTIVVYTSDQGFFLGDHGWYDKRFMYEPSLRMPFVAQYPKAIAPGTTSDALVINADFAPTFLDFAGVKAPAVMQGQSFRAALEGKALENPRESVYYHYYEYPDADHMVSPHYGVRTRRHKLIRYYGPADDWELFDLESDPNELKNVYDQPQYAEIQSQLKAELEKLRAKYEVTDGPKP